MAAPLDWLSWDLELSTDSTAPACLAAGLEATFATFRAPCLVALTLETVDLWLEVDLLADLFTGFADRLIFALVFAAIGRLTLKHRRMGNLYGMPTESQATEDGTAS